MRTLQPLGLLVVALALAGCPDGVIQEEFSSIVVYGEVRTASGAPVAGAEVTAQARDLATCGQVTDRAADTTDTSGRYIAVLGRFGGTWEACVAVRASVPSGVPGAPDSTTRKPVRIGRGGLDSLRVDLVLGTSP